MRPFFRASAMNFFAGVQVEEALQKEPVSEMK
jgi:hypothetical protein